jgi:hypothetical protein
VTLLSADGYGAAKPQPKEQAQKEAQSLWPQKTQKNLPAYECLPGAYKRRECSFCKSKFFRKTDRSAYGRSVDERKHTTLFLWPIDLLV